VGIELRRVTEDEFPAYARAIATAFGSFPDEQGLVDWRSTTELDRTIAVFDGNEIVGTAGAYSFELTVPGGVGARAAGVTFVGVRPTHRRRGLLRRMMQFQLDDVIARGEPLMVLTASEAAIYERFGYGAAVFASRWTLRTDALELARPSTAGGRMRMVDPDEARKVVPGIFDRARGRHVGAVTRSDARWDTVFADRKDDRQRRSWFTVIHESESGEPDGFVFYKVEFQRGEGSPQNTIVLMDLDALDDEVEAALWDYLVHVDLVVSIRTENRPVDEPLQWRLADQRRVHVDSVGDHLWVRVVDPAVALAARRYATDDALVLELTDPFRPDNGGCWLIDGGPDGAHTVRTDRAPDLSLSAPELGSIYLGGVSPSTLARAGRSREVAPGALARADAFFATHPAPWCATHF
jgi:predicted acetyltransferase